MPLWRPPQPLVLASTSSARRMLLEGAGIPVEVRPAMIDERAIEVRAALARSGSVAALLAVAKARAVSASMPGRYVVGADQTLALGERRFSKPGGRDGAREQLRALRGKTHMLHSGAAMVHDGRTLFEHVAAATLTMREFSDRFVEDYLDTVGEAATASVGGYQLEGVGAQLFERVEGDYSTILGLPLLPVLDGLRRAGLLEA